jgi:hypothetical protein
MSYIELFMCAMLLYWLVLATILSFDACHRSAYIANNTNVSTHRATDTAGISDGVSDASSNHDSESRRGSDCSNGCSICTTSSDDLGCDESASADMVSTGIHKRTCTDVVDVNE